MSSPFLTGIQANNPTKYLGPNVALESIVIRNRAPTGADVKQPNTGKYYPFGILWLVGEITPNTNPVTGLRGDLWYLAYIAGGIGYWIKFGSSIAFSFDLQVQTFTTSGTYTPTPNMVYAQIELVGSGGGGGGSGITISSQFASAGGGGGGEYAIGTFDAATIGASKVITIGPAGAGGIGALDGGNGGVVSVGALISANGGLGGVGATSTVGAGFYLGGNGGTGGSGGSLRYPGVYGGNSYFSSADQLASGGSGGGSRYSGGIRDNFTANSDGVAGNGYGGGGSGATNAGVNPARTGGAGSDGIVYITEYILV